MDSKDKDILMSLGYFQYAVAPYEKFCKQIAFDSIELRIRTTSPEEQAIHGKKYAAKACRRDGSAFGIGFEVFFGDDIEVLDKKMQEDTEEKCKLIEE